MKVGRIVVGALATAAVLLVFAFDHRCGEGFFSAVLLSIIAFTSALEVSAILERIGIAPFKWSTAFASLVVALVPALVLRLRWNVSPFAPQAGVIFGFMILMFFFATRAGDLARGVRAVAAGTFTLVYVGLALSFLVRLRLLGQFGESLLLFAVGVAKIGDICAYFLGKSIGRHPLASRLSPKKTVEGALGGLIGGIIVAFVMRPYLCAQIAFSTLLLWALLLGAAAQLGDLAESLLKRAAAVKDSGLTFAAMGGVLDMVDSLLLSAPLAYILALWGGFGTFQG